MLYVNVALPLPIDRLFTYAVPDDQTLKIKIGQSVVVPFGKREYIGYIIDFPVLLNPRITSIKNIKTILPDVFIVNKNLFDLTKWMSEYYFCSWGEAIKSAILLKKIPSKFAPDIEKNEFKKEKLVDEEGFLLTKEQETAFSEICKFTKESKFETLLLFGVTGSGKTEVYLRAIKETLKLGKEAIVLIPEIALTPQTVERFLHRFPDDLAILHSHLSIKERAMELHKIQTGRAKIIIGARSAIFAPVRNLGLIIIDEEHETSYKQEDDPRYHAREVAIMRAKLSNAVVVLGTATPALESYYHTSNEKYKLLKLSQRIYGRAMPEVKIVDMKLEKRVNNSRIFSNALVTSVEEKMSKGEQIILFLNRRGYATFLICSECGSSFKCPRCSVSLIYHSTKKNIICHYCGYQKNVPDICPKCNGHNIKHFGFGTERIEAEIKTLFPNAKVGRMDADTTGTKKSHERILTAFKNKEIDILVGTQMITKGLDFPNVTLVGVVSADTMLNLPDFRSAERTFNLITQVAGRAGRGEKPGEVLVQTYNPEHYSIVNAKTHNYVGFYNYELEVRRELFYPPFSHLINIVGRGSDGKKVEEVMLDLAKNLRDEINQLKSKIIVLGPAPAPIEIVRRKYRWQLLIKTEKVEILNSILHKCIGKSSKGSVIITVDIDPVTVL